jgi:pimeloyl-ACP methyl ester carboxylesterase
MNELETSMKRMRTIATAMSANSRMYLAVFLVMLVASILATGTTIDGITLHSSSHGIGPKTVILVHGWTCDDTTWDAQVPALSKQYRVLTLDLPGHGKSGSPKDGLFSMELFARAVEAVRNEAKAEKVVLVGHSMGTPVVVQYARMFPDHTAALVFVDGLVRIGTGAASAPNPQQFAGSDGRKARENMIRGMFSASTTPAMQSHILNMMLGAPEATAVGAMKATWGFPSPKDEVIKVPVLGLYADHSRLADLDFMKTTYPKLQYIEIPGTGHFLMMEKPDEFNRHVLAFLKTLSF